MMLDLRDITVDNELKELLPPLAADELADLRESILRDGFTSPIIVWLNHGVLVDGHHRLEIWKNDLNGDDDKAPEIREQKFADKQQVIEWMLRNQLARRNLTDAQRVQIALKLKPIIEAKAKQNQIAGGGAVRKKSSEPVRTMKVVAEVARVSEPRARQAEAVLKSGDDATKKAMLSGEKKINLAFKETKQRTSEPAKPIQKVITAPVLVGEFVDAISLGLKRLRDKHHAHGVEFDAKLVRKMAFNYLEGALRE